MNTLSPKNIKRIAIIKGGERYSTRTEEAAAHLRSRIISAGHDVLDIHHVSDNVYLHEGKEKEPHAVLPYADAVIDLSSSSRKHNKLSSHIFESVLTTVDTVRMLSQMNISTPRSIVIRRTDSANLDNIMYDIWRTMHTPLIIKCNHSKYPSLLTFNYDEAYHYVKFLHDKKSDAVVCEYIEGDKFMVTVIPNFRGESYYSPIPLYITRPKYDLSPHHESSNMASSSHANIAEAAKAVSKGIHQKMGLSSPATYEFVSNKNKMHLVSMKTKLDFHPDSKFSKSLGTTGIHVGHLISNYI